MKFKKLLLSLLMFALPFGMVTSLVGCSSSNEGKAVNKIMIATKPEKLTYDVGEYFDPTGMVLVAKYADGSTGSVTEGYTWDITTPLEEDDDEIMITYKYRSCLLDININIKNPKTIEVKTLPTKTTYVIGDKFDPTGLVLIGTYEDGSTEEYTTGYRYSKASVKVTDTQWKITYNRAICYVPITVKAAEVVSLQVTTPPSKTEYVEGEYFSTDGVVISALYDNGDVKPISDYSYAPEGQLDASTNHITFSYNSFSVAYPITVTAAPLKIKLSTNPTKLEYNIGENFDPTGMVVQKTDNGTTTTLNSGEYTIVNGDNLQVGSIVKIKLNSNPDITCRIPLIITNEVDITVKDHVTGKATEADNKTLIATAKNGHYVANFEESSLVTVEFDSLNAGKAGLFIKSASTYVTEYSSVSKSTWYYPIKTGDVQANKLFKVTINDVDVAIPDSVIYEGSETTDPNGDVKLLAVWKNVEMNNVDVKLGKNVLKITFLKQIYKNADVTIGKETKSGVLSSPVLDTVSIKYQCINGTEHTHAYNQEVVDPKYLAHAADCLHKATYYKSCACGAIGTETFENGELGDHNYEIITKGDKDYEHCTVCGDEHEITCVHNYKYSATEKDGVLTLTKECTKCTYKTTKTMNSATVGVAKSDAGYSAGDASYYDLGASNLIGTNDLAGMVDQTAAAKLVKKGDRTTGNCLAETTSVNVVKALENSCGHDYLVSFYNGAGFEVKFNSQAAGKRAIVVKCASGYCDPSAFHTADMLLNKIGLISINGNNVTIPDTYVLHGKDGGSDYGVAHTNWEYLVFVVDVVNGENSFKFVSKEFLNSNNKVIYHDAPRDGTDSTMATAKFDAVAVFEA